MGLLVRERPGLMILCEVVYITRLAACAIDVPKTSTLMRTNTRAA